MIWARTPGLSRGCISSMPGSYTFCVPGQLFVFDDVNNVLMTPWERLDAELARRRTSWTSLAEALETTKQAVGHWKTRGIPAKNMRAAAEFVGRSLEWLEFGDQVLDAPAPKPQPKEIDLENNPDYPAIRRVKLKAQAGVSGFSVEYSQEDDGPPIVFRADWYKLKGFRPEKMLALRVKGESMIPSLYEGDLIVINTVSTEPKQGIPFLVSYEGEICVKRLVRDDGLWWLTSDNPDQRRYPRTKCNGGTEIIGEVVYRQTERV